MTEPIYKATIHGITNPIITKMPNAKKLSA
jgi:hypothetical protein